MIRFMLLSSTAKCPLRASPGAAGFDLYADQDVTIPEGSHDTVATNVAVELTKNHAGFVWPRSGLSYKKGTDVLAGVIDSDYRDGIHVILHNNDRKPLVIKQGDRIGQLVVQKIETDFEVVDSMSETKRGTGRFGSTGMR